MWSQPKCTGTPTPIEMRYIAGFEFMHDYRAIEDGRIIRAIVDSGVPSVELDGPTFVRTNSADLDKAAARVRCSATAFAILPESGTTDVGDRLCWSYC